MEKITICFDAFLIFSVLYQSVIATPLTLPCDEEIEDKEIYENIVVCGDFNTAHKEIDIS